MNFKDEAIYFAKKLLTLYVETRDMEQLLANISEDFSMVGTGEMDVCVGAEAARAFLRTEENRCPEGYELKKYTFNAFEVDAASVVVYGSFEAICKENPDIPMGNRFSGVCTKNKGEFRLRHLHLSNSDGTRIKQALAVVRSKEAQMAELAQNIPAGSHRCIADEHFTIISMSDSFIEMTGFTRKEISETFSNRFLDMVAPEDRAHLFSEMRVQLEKSDVTETEYRILRKDGTTLWVLDRGKLTRVEDGTKTLYCILLDITNQREQRESLRLSLERHKIIMNQTSDVLFEWDIISDSLLFSANWNTKFGYEPIEVANKILNSQNVHPDDLSGFKILIDMTVAGAPYTEREFRISDVLGNYKWQKIRVTNQYDSDGKPIKAVGVIIDIDSEKRKTENLIERAQKDALTGLLNKIATQELTQELLKDCGGGAMLIFDIDEFKHINDSLGHFYGDGILVEFASVLKKHFRATDILGRIGGDEFLAFLPGAKEDVAGTLANKILGLMKSVKAGSGNRIISSSVGCAIFPQDGKSFVELYKAADLALYYSKNFKKGQYTHYEECKCKDGTVCGPHGPGADSPIDFDFFNKNDQMAQYSFRMLYGATDPMEVIKNLLEIVGSSCGVSRVYIFENSEDNRYCNNTFEWCASGIEPQIGHLQNVSYADDIPGFLELFGSNGMIYCASVEELPSNITAFIKPQEVKAMLHCAIKDDGQFRGFVGFDDCEGTRAWSQAQIESLSLISDIIGTFLLKIRYKEKTIKAPTA